MKKGFTLLELLAVVLIVAVVGVSATLAFSNIDDDTADEDLKNKYTEIQRAANLYLDLHSSDIEWFMNNRVIYYKLSDLRNENYITDDLSDPVHGDDISTNLYVKLYIASDNSEVSSCIVDRLATGEKCIADHFGNYNNITNCCE